MNIGLKIPSTVRLDEKKIENPSRELCKRLFLPLKCSEGANLNNKFYKLYNTKYYLNILIFNSRKYYCKIT